MRNPWKSFFQKKLHTAKEEARYRKLSVLDSITPGYALLGNKKLLNLSSNDYLGLAKDQESMEEARILAEILPSGAGASRLITGSFAIQEELERLLAEWKKTESALVFPSGYQTNVGLIAALVGSNDAVFCDKLNHASLLDGCRLSGAILHRYPHKDVEDLESMLKTSSSPKKLIVTDGVFSMDGDIAPLPEIYELAKRYHALLLVDEAHATGVLGEAGAGSWAHFQLPADESVILMGTLSKAVGAQGGFVCAAKTVVDYLINYCRAFIYSTGLSPFLAGIAHFNITRIRSDHNLLDRLQQIIRVTQTALQTAGLLTKNAPTPIFPILIGECDAAVKISQSLLRKKILVHAIRPPTVPEGTARLRLSVSAAHLPEEIQRAAEIIAETVRKFVKSVPT